MDDKRCVIPAIFRKTDGSKMQMKMKRVKFKEKIYARRCVASRRKFGSIFVIKNAVEGRR